MTVLHVVFFCNVPRRSWSFQNSGEPTFTAERIILVTDWKVSTWELFEGTKTCLDLFCITRKIVRSTVEYASKQPIGQRADKHEFVTRSTKNLHNFEMSN